MTITIEEGPLYNTTEAIEDVKGKEGGMKRVGAKAKEGLLFFSAFVFKLVDLADFLIGLRKALAIRQLNDHLRGEM